ncbi:unnamed protein product, partial [Scytosiphon promiscuus]
PRLEPSPLPSSVSPHPPAPVVSAPPLVDDTRLHPFMQSFCHVDWATEQRKDSDCAAVMRYLSLGSPLPPPDDLVDVLQSIHRPRLSEVLSLASKTRLHTTDDDTTL